MEHIFIEFKYSFLGDMNRLIESLSEIEGQGLVSKISPNPAPLRLYEHERYRIAISPDRVDFYPKGSMETIKDATDLNDAFSVFSKYYSGQHFRIAINCAMVSVSTKNNDELLYSFRGIAINKDFPTEFLMRINNQVTEAGCTFNSIVTISKGQFNRFGKIEPAVFLQFDINTAPETSLETIKNDAESVIGTIVDLYNKGKKEYVQ